MSEAEALVLDDSPDGKQVAKKIKVRPPLWRTFFLAGLALAEGVTWFTLASYRLSFNPGAPNYLVISAFMTAFSWLPAMALPVIRPKVTAPYDLFILYLSHLFSGFFYLGTIWYEHHVNGFSSRTWDVVIRDVNFLVIILLLAAVLVMPIGMPSTQAIAEKIVSLCYLTANNLGVSF